nr:immunoglobulin light chain junction region [Macaca mulatta]
CLQSYSSPSSF